MIGDWRFKTNLFSKLQNIYDKNTIVVVLTHPIFWKSIKYEYEVDECF